MLRFGKKAAKQILPNIIPFLIVKKELAKLQLEAINLLPHRGARTKIIKKELLRLENIYQKMRVLNRKSKTSKLYRSPKDERELRIT